MDEKIVGKQIFEFYRSTFEKTMDAMILFQQQNQRMVDLYLEQVPELPEESKKVIQDWRESLEQGTIDFKACMDQAFKKAEKFFSRPGAETIKQGVRKDEQSRGDHFSRGR